MNDRTQGPDLDEAQRRAQEAKEAWKRAKDDLKEAFKRAKEERRHLGADDEVRREEIDEAVEEIVDAAREFAREVSDEASRLARETWHGARHEWHGRWREQWERSFGKDWQSHWVFGGRRFRQWTAGEETNPFVGAMLSRGGGLLAVYVLHLLEEQPRHGNDVMRQIEQRTLGSWASNPGAIYPLLSSMEENGLVQSRWEDPDKRTRRIYQVTDEGRQEVSRLRRVLRPKVMEAIEVLHALYDDLYGREEPAGPGGKNADREDYAPTADTGAAGSDEEETNAQASTGDEGDAEGQTSSGEARPWRNRFGRLFGRGTAPATAFGN